MTAIKHNKNWQNFLEFCHSAKTKEQLADLFEIVLTPAEKDDIAMRCAILDELNRGELTQREIAKKLKISVAKVSRGANALKITKTSTVKLLTPSKR